MQAVTSQTLSTKTPIASDAIGVFALSLLSYVIGGPIASIIALVLVPNARRKIVESNGTLRGLALVKAAKILAIVNIILVVLMTIVFVVALLTMDFSE